MPHYTAITIIYNPISTGPGEKLAHQLATDLQKTLPKKIISVMPTEYAGHAEVLAYEAAVASGKPLIISASGDGGYHEVVNGLMKAQLEGAKPVAGLLPAGNANDHFRELHEHEMVDAILSGKEKVIDLLKLTATSKRQPLIRYAHSYIGLGLTLQGARELNKTQLNTLKEAWIVLKILIHVEPVRLIVRGRQQLYDSLIFSNVSKMSKVLSLSPVAAPDDGKFEVTAFDHRHKLKLLVSLLQATTIGRAEDEQTNRYEFKTTRSTRIQLDGEIKKLKNRTTVTITSEHKVLRCVV